MLASDIANPEFQGAANPDQMLDVEFYWYEPLDWNKQQETGKEVRGPKVPYVRISQPGNRLSIIETPVRDDHKARWPQKWLAWQMREGLIDGAQEDIPGWKLEEWAVLNADQLRELKYLRFSTVEQLAGASDSQVQRLGIGGIGLREQARQAVKERARAEVKTEMEARDKEIAELRRRDAEREAELASIKQLLMNQRPRRGRPPKVKDGTIG